MKNMIYEDKILTWVNQDEEDEEEVKEGGEEEEF